MGLIRIFLALSVVMQHTGGTFFGLRGMHGFGAVNAFFMISGFYMALVLTEKYKSDNNKVFYVSRLARLFPTYLIGISIALLVILISPGQNLWSLPIDPFGRLYVLLANLFIFGQDLLYVVCVPDGLGHCADAVKSSLNPPGWSIAVELMFYAIAPFVLRSISRTLVFTVLGLSYYWFVGRFGDQYLAFWREHILPTAQIDNLRYYFFPASILFFGLGALSCHIKMRLEAGDRRKAMWIAGLIVVLMLAVRPFASLDWPKTTAFFMFLPVIFHVTKNWSIDRMIGDLSYPVYILHFPILAYLKGHAHLQAGPLTVATIAITVVSAILVFVAVERPVDALRARLVRQRL